jgi:uncharacterized membrane protein YhiD involved in acid resistance
MVIIEFFTENELKFLIGIAISIFAGFLIGIEREIFGFITNIK